MSNLNIRSFLLLYFLASFSISLYWYQSGYFSVLDIFFDADPITNLSSIAHAWGRHVVTHAFLELFSIPIRAIENIFSSFNFITDKKEFREVLALSISPIFSTLNILMFFLLLNKLKIKQYDVIIFTLIYIFAFSNLIFSFIPETFSISGFLICATIYYFIVCSHNTQKNNPYVWLLLAIFLCGITITNIFIFAIIYSIYLINIERKNLFNSLSITILFSMLSISVTICIYFASDIILNIQTDNVAGLSYLSDYFVDSGQQLFINMVNFLNSSIHSIVGILPSTRESMHDTTFSSNSLTLIQTDNLAFWAAYPLIIFSLAAHALYKNIDIENKNIYIISIIVIAFNFMLHAVFGREIFLYTQHWLTPLFILLIPLLKDRRILSTGVLLFVASININILLKFDDLISASII